MLYRYCLLLVFTLSFATAQTAIPDTPAGHILRIWLEAFNSGDRARLDAYYQKYQPSQSAENMMAFRTNTGGFDRSASTATNGCTSKSASRNGTARPPPSVGST